MANAFSYLDTNAIANRAALAECRLGNDDSFNLTKISLYFIFFGLFGLDL